MNRSAFFAVLVVILILDALLAYYNFLQHWAEGAARRHVPMRQGMHVVVDLGQAQGRSLLLWLVQRIGFRRFGGMLIVYSPIQQTLHRLESSVADQSYGIMPTYLLGHAITGVRERDMFDAIILLNGLVAPNQQIPTLEGLFTALKSGGILSIIEARWLTPHHPPDAVRQMAQTAGLVEHAFWYHRLLYTRQFEKPTPSYP